MTQPTLRLAPALRLPAAMMLAFALLFLAGLIWTPFAPSVQAWLERSTGQELPPDRGFVLSTVVLIPLLLSVWGSLKLLPDLKRKRSTDLLAIFAISAAATCAWYLAGPVGSPDISYVLALVVSWFLLLNR